VNRPVNDRDLAEYLKRDSAVSHEYKRLGDEAPPTELQRAVLERAQEAIERERAGVPRPPPRRWMPLFALAATIVLACLVVLEFELHHIRLLPGLEPKNATESEGEAVTILLDTPEQPMPQAAVADKPAPAARVMPQRQAEQKVRARREFAAEQDSEKAEAPARAPAAPAPSALGEIAHQEAKRTDSLQASPAVASVQTLRTPQEWLASIDALKKEGKMHEAEQELAAFHKAYPQIQVPK